MIRHITCSASTMHSHESFAVLDILYLQFRVCLHCTSLFKVCNTKSHGISKKSYVNMPHCCCKCSPGSEGGVVETVYKEWVEVCFVTATEMVNEG